MKAATSENKKRGSFGTTASVLIVTNSSTKRAKRTRADDGKMDSLLRITCSIEGKLLLNKLHCLVGQVQLEMHVLLTSVLW
jgi:hypothetical protein